MPGNRECAFARCARETIGRGPRHRVPRRPPKVGEARGGETRPRTNVPRAPERSPGTQMRRVRRAYSRQGPARDRTAPGGAAGRSFASRPRLRPAPPGRTPRAGRGPSPSGYAWSPWFLLSCPRCKRPTHPKRTLSPVLRSTCSVLEKSSASRVRGRGSVALELPACRCRRDGPGLAGGGGGRDPGGGFRPPWCQSPAPAGGTWGNESNATGAPFRVRTGRAGPPDSSRRKTFSRVIPSPLPAPGA